MADTVRSEWILTIWGCIDPITTLPAFPARKLVHFPLFALSVARVCVCLYWRRQNLHRLTFFTAACAVLQNSPADPWKPNIGPSRARTSVVFFDQALGHWKETDAGDLHNARWLVVRFWISLPRLALCLRQDWLQTGGLFCEDSVVPELNALPERIIIVNSELTIHDGSVLFQSRTTLVSQSPSSCSGQRRSFSSLFWSVHDSTELCLKYCVVLFPSGWAPGLTQSRYMCAGINVTGSLLANTTIY